MNVELIADAGSTKVEWVALDSNGVESSHFTTPGVNAILSADAHVRSVFEEARRILGKDTEVTDVHYYGAGCATPQVNAHIAGLLREAFGDDVCVEVASDLLGAARSLLGRSAGIACILGTGSNSCLYDGRNVVHNVPSLGFILGDEGSGAALGRRFVADAFKGLMPRPLAEAFTQTTGLDVPTLLECVYRSEAPNKFLASLVPFIADNIADPYVASLVCGEFESFLRRNITPYQGATSLPIAFTGGIAWHFADLLRQAGQNVGFNIGRIVERPIGGLVEYHRVQKNQEGK